MSVHDRRNQCLRYLNQNVQVKTIHGMTYRGRLINVDHERAYLQVSSIDRPNDGRAHISFFPFIIPLVLFDLLVIALIDGRRPFFW